MENNGKKITIKDVARLSGVSKGTVDRVVHDRGEVSERSKRRVLEVIERIGYEPNLYASMLATKKHYRVVCLIPCFQPGEYWELVHQGIERAKEKAAGYNIEAEVISFDQFDRNSFLKAMAETLAKKPSAVVLAPIFVGDTERLTGELSAAGIPFVYVDSRIEQTPYLAYFGMPMLRSGHLAGSLIADPSGLPAIANFRIERGAAPQDNPTRRRREGFLHYMADHSPQTQIHEIFIRPYDPAHNARTMDSFFERHPDVHHIVTFNSRVHLIAEYLERRALTDMTLVGFDKLPANLDGLRKGFIKFLITQRTETQAYRAINALIDLLILHRSPAERDNYMSMDILTRYNVDYCDDFYDM